MTNQIPTLIALGDHMKMIVHTISNQTPRNKIQINGILLRKKI